MHTNTCKYKQLCMHAFITITKRALTLAGTDTHTNTHAHTQIHTLSHTHAHTHTRTRTRTHTCTHAHAHAHTHTHITASRALLLLTACPKGLRSCAAPLPPPLLLPFCFCLWCRSCSTSDNVPDKDCRLEKALKACVHFCVVVCVWVLVCVCVCAWFVCVHVI